MGVSGRRRRPAGAVREPCRRWRPPSTAAGCVGNSYLDIGDYRFFNGQNDFTIIGNRSGGGIDVEGTATLDAFGGPFDKPEFADADVDVRWAYDRIEDPNDSGQLIGGSLLEGATVSGSVALWVDVIGATPDSIDFYIDSDHIRTEMMRPYEIAGSPSEFNTQTLTNGDHTLRVVLNYGSDTYEQTVQFTVSNDAPPTTIRWSEDPNAPANEWQPWRTRPSADRCGCGPRPSPPPTPRRGRGPSTGAAVDAAGRVWQLDTTQLADGDHAIDVIVSVPGEQDSYADGRFTVANDFSPVEITSNVDVTGTWCVNGSGKLSPTT